MATLVLDPFRLSSVRANNVRNAAAAAPPSISAIILAMKLTELSVVLRTLLTLNISTLLMNSYRLLLFAKPNATGELLMSPFLPGRTNPVHVATLKVHWVLCIERKLTCSRSPLVPNGRNPGTYVLASPAYAVDWLNLALVSPSVVHAAPELHIQRFPVLLAGLNSFASLPLLPAHVPVYLSLANKHATLARVPPPPAITAENRGIVLVLAPARPAPMTFGEALVSLA